ncbi:unnamed protein product [Phytomonas sp. EM1]|nr:unnamed protein product [Phytomonas sp. EM1]|eukprot:CCW60248.1 unnamed protein product [Phytomonas sp. isolate EM1]
MTSTWIESCPVRVKKLIASLPKKHIKLVKTHEPTKFSVREMLKGTFVVSINRKHVCSCHGAQPCIHVLFILINYFNLENHNPLVWQDGIWEAEIVELISSRKIKDDSSCSLCQQRLSQKSGCPFCNEQFHWHCAVLRSRALHDEYVTCGRCHTKLDKCSVSQILCSACRSDCESHSYKCCFCPSYRLCNKCYSAGKAHAHHPFSKDNSASSSIYPKVTAQDVNSLQHREINPEDYEILLSLENNRSTTLSLSEFEKLPKVLWHGDMNCVTCGICLEGFKIDEVLVQFPCSHFFHLPCSRKWTTEHKAECPIDHRSILHGEKYI